MCVLSVLWRVNTIVSCIYTPCFATLALAEALADTLVINSEFLTCSVDLGFVLVLPLHHGDLEHDSVGVSTKNYQKIVLLFW